MNKYQVSRFKMLSNVLTTFNPDSKAIWSMYLVIVLTIDNLINLAKNMKAASSTKGGKGGGATLDKNKVLSTLKDKGYRAALRLKLLANQINNTELATDASFTKKSFNEGGEQAIVDRATWVLTQSRLLEKDAKAAGCGVTAAKNDELAALLDSLNEKEDNQQQSSTSGIKVTQDLGSYFRTLTKELKTLDEAMFSNVAENNPDFYQLYLIARRKIDPPSKPRKGKNPPKGGV